MTRLLHFATGYVALLAFLLLSPTHAKADSFLITGNTFPGVATATLNITTLTNGELCFTLTNTSAVGVITGVGFDLPGTGMFTLDSITGGSGTFTFSTNPGNVPQFNSAVLDFAFVTNTDNFTGGNPPSGTNAGLTTPVFCVLGNFSGFSQQQIADAIFVRFQSLPNGQSDVGRVTTPIPEPASMTLLGVGLLGAAGALRRRRKKG